MANTPEIFNWFKRYRVLAQDMTDLQSLLMGIPAGFEEGTMNGAILEGMVPATGGLMTVSISGGIGAGPTGYLHNPAGASIEFTAPTGSFYARNLIVARPVLTDTDYMTNPTNPIQSVPLHTIYGSQFVKIDGVAASSPSYPATEPNDLVVCGVRTYAGQAVIAPEDFDFAVRDAIGKNSAFLQNLANYDDRLRAYRLSNQVLGIKPSQLSESLGNAKAFKAAANNRASIFPKTPAGNFNANDTFLNFQTGAITGGDGSSSAFTPTVPGFNQWIVATVTLRTDSTLQVSYGTAGIRQACFDGIKNQLTSGAGSVSIPTSGQPIAFVMLGSANGATITEMDVFDARGIIQGGGGGNSNGFLNFLTNGDFEQSSPGTIPDSWGTYAETESVTFTDAGDLVTVGSILPTAGDTVSFTVINSTTGISTNTLYYVINPSTLSFQLSLTAGGSAIVLTTNGTGTMVRGKPKTASSGTANITFLATSTNPLDGSVSAVLTKDAANRMGQGVYRSFTVPLGWRGAPRLTAITLLLGSSVTNYVAGDLSFWVLDVDAGVVITPSVTPIPRSNNGYQLNFLSTTSTNFKLIIHVSTPSALAYAPYFDDFVVTPQPPSQGPAVGEPQSVTITGTWTTNSTYTAKETRIGSWAHYQMKVALSGAPNNVTLKFNLPAGRTIDTSAMVSIAGLIPDSSGEANDATALDNVLVVSYDSPTSVVPVYLDDSGTGVVIQNILNATLPFTFASGDFVTIYFAVPIAEWAGSGTLNLGPGAQVQWISDDGTNDVFGPDGALVPSVAFGTGVTQRDITMSNAQKNRMYRLEINYRGNGWTDAAAQFPVLSGNNGNANNFYGCQGLWSSSTNFRVSFGNRGTSIAASNADNGNSSWATENSNGTRYRLVDANPSSPVGFSLAGTDQSAGLLKPGLAPGFNGAAAIGALYTGEDLRVAISTNISIGTPVVNTYYDMLSLSGVTAGMWRIDLQSMVATTGLTTAQSCILFLTLTDTSNNIIEDLGMVYVSGINLQVNNFNFSKPTRIPTNVGTVKVRMKVVSGFGTVPTAMQIRGDYSGGWLVMRRDA